MKQCIYVLLLGLLSSCTPIFMGITGIRNPKPLSKSAIDQKAERWGIPKEASYSIDSGSYKAVLRTISDESLRNNHGQPLQAMYYLQGDYLTSYQINCYAGGFPNLNWKRDGMMETFPPKLQAPLDSLFTKQHILAHLTPKLEVPQRPVVIVFWSVFMNRQSKRFIKTLQQNAALSSNPVTFIYVNVDPLFWSMNPE